MSSADSLIGVGVPAEVAKRAGFDVLAVTTSGTTQNSGTGVLRGAGNKIVQATIHAGTGAITLPSDSGIGDEIIVSNLTATAGQVFPPTGGNINGNSANAAATLAVTATASATWRFVKVNATLWAGFAAADQT